MIWDSLQQCQLPKVVLAFHFFIPACTCTCAQTSGALPPQPLDSIPDQELKLLKVAQNEFLGFGIAGTHTTHSIDHKLVDLELEYRPVY